MLSITCTLCVVFVLCVLTVTGQYNEGDSCYESNTRSYGTCTRSNQCVTAYTAYVNSNIRFDKCGYVFDMPIVCCVENLNQANNNRWPSGQTQASRPTRPQQTFRPSQTPSRPVSQGTSRPTQQASRPSSRPQQQNNRQKRICEEKCKEYSASVTQTYGVIPLLTDPIVTNFEQPKCNYVANPLVVGGEVTELGEFPHMAAVGWPKVSGDGYVWLCGGSLISDRYVLTAGHCTYQRANEEAESGRPQVVRLGDHDLRDDVADNAEPTTVKIEAIVKNPGYKSPSKYHDIALLKLEDSVEFSNFVRPACLYVNDPLVEKSVIATGWGTTTNKGSTSDVLRKVALKVFDNADCQPNFEFNRNWKEGFSADQMCAGDDRGGKDTCQGDSGGPLQVESPENQCIFYIVGVTGFGGVCGNPKGSGVYAIVSHYLDWIEDEVWIKNQ